MSFNSILLNDINRSTMARVGGLNQSLISSNLLLSLYSMKMAHFVRFRLVEMRLHFSKVNPPSMIHNQLNVISQCRLQ